MTNEIKPIEIFSSNLVTSAAQITSSSTQDNAGALLIEGGAQLWRSANSAEQNAYIEIASDGAVPADALLIKNSNLSSLTLSYKADAEDETYASLSAFTLTQAGEDIFIKFDAPLSFEILRIVYGGSSELCYAKELIVCNSLLLLDDVLSSLEQDIYFKGGHHYLEDGSLMLWEEFSKNALSVKLSNVTKEKKNSLLALLKQNDFLTCVFYGAYEMSLSSQYGLRRPAKVILGRVLALYEISLELMER